VGTAGEDVLRRHPVPQGGGVKVGNEVHVEPIPCGHHLGHQERAQVPLVAFRSKQSIVRLADVAKEVDPVPWSDQSECLGVWSQLFGVVDDFLQFVLLVF